MSDLIDRQSAIEVMRKAKDKSEAHRMLVQLPPAQPGCEDAVSRKAAINALPYLLDYEGFKGESGYVSKNLVRTMLKGLPSVTLKQPGWIPCKTRKPEKSGLYLVTKQQKTGEIQLATAHYNTAFDEWSGNGNFKKVLAWQPLPSPWKGSHDAD